MFSVKIDLNLKCCYGSPFNPFSSIAYNDLEMELDDKNSDCLDTDNKVQLNSRIDSGR